VFELIGIDDHGVDRTARSRPAPVVQRVEPAVGSGRERVDERIGLAPGPQAMDRCV
jgi:hypothetical protein